MKKKKIVKKANKEIIRLTQLNNSLQLEINKLKSTIAYQDLHIEARDKKIDEMIKERLYISFREKSCLNCDNFRMGQKLKVHGYCLRNGVNNSMRLKNLYPCSKFNYK